MSNSYRFAAGGCFRSDSVGKSEELFFIDYSRHGTRFILSNIANFN